MFIFGHTGITLGVATLLNGILIKSHTPPKNELAGKQQSLQEPSDSENGYARGISSWPASLASRIDARLLLIGSLLPDIIDKPVGWVFFRDTFSNGRIYGHTLLFLIVITLGGLYLYWRRHKTWLLALSFGTFTHLILDLMWRAPKTLLWPLYGWQFEREAYPENWILIIYDIIHFTLNHPIMSIPEIAGVLVLAWFGWSLLHKRKPSA